MWAALLVMHICYAALGVLTWRTGVMQGRTEARLEALSAKAAAIAAPATAPRSREDIQRDGRAYLAACDNARANGNLGWEGAEACESMRVAYTAAFGAQP